jgi:hypothetical protein
MAQVELDKTQVRERTRKCRIEDWFDNIFRDLGSGYANVGP